MKSERNGEELAESTGVTNPLALLKAMVDQKIDPEALKKMMDLSERWEANQAKKAYKDAMTEAQRQMRAVVKDKENSHTHSMYAALESVQEMARPIYTEHGFSLSWGQGKPEKEGWVKYLCTVSHRGGHAEVFEGNYPQDGTGMKGGSNMSSLQGVVSTGTYCQRDMLRLIFNITIAGADKDGNVLGVLVNTDQIRAVNDVLAELRELGAPVDFARFLKWLNVESLEHLKQADHAKAMNELNARRRKAQAEKDAKAAAELAAAQGKAKKEAKTP